MQIQFRSETDVYQIHDQKHIREVLLSDGRLVWLRGETITFLGETRLFLDATFTNPDGRLATLLLVEATPGNGINLVLPARFQALGAPLLGRITTDIGNSLTAAFGKRAEPLREFMLEDDENPLPLAEETGDMVIPGRTVYDKLLPLLDRYRLAATLIKPGQRVLDLNCGCGAGLAMLTAADARCGIDPRPGALNLAEKFLPPTALQLVCAEPAPLELMRGFDLVIGHLSGPTIGRHQEFIDAATRHLHRDGRLFLYVDLQQPQASPTEEPREMAWNAARLIPVLEDRFDELAYATQAGKNADDLALAWDFADGASDNGAWICVSAGRPRPVRIFPEVSVIIPVYNKSEYTERCLAALKDRFPPGVAHEIIVIDNASTDATAGMLTAQAKKWGSSLRTLRNETNLGFARACNQGALLARGRIIVFLNNDTEVHDQWLPPLIDELDTRPATGVVGGRLLFPNGTVQHAGVAVRRSKIPFHIHRGLPGESPLVTERRLFPMITAACSAVRRHEFLELGMFDEGYINGHEDVDLCLRYRKKGKECVYRPECVVTHYEEVSEGRLDKRDYNVLRLFGKWRNDLIQDDFCFAFPESARPQIDRPLTFAIKIGVPTRAKTNWGDIFFAEGLAKSIVRKGHRCRIDYLNEWGGQDLESDVVIHIKGLSIYKPKPHNINIMWMINHPSLHTDEEMARYDAVLVASLPHARELAARLSVPVLPFLQATDPEHFRPHPEIAKQFDLVFVGNNHGTDRLPLRQIVADLLPMRYRLGVWGDGWTGKLPAGVFQGNFVPHEELPKVYASGRIVLNDHQAEMKSAGFVNNRTFDAVACGAVLISDAVHGQGDVLPVYNYRSAKELRLIVDRILRNYPAEEKKTADLRARLLESYTFDQRADEILRFIGDLPKAQERAQAARTRNSRIVIATNPLVSIMVSTYNRRQFLPATLQSIQAQTHANWELILVNDGGDPVDDIVAQAGDPRIRLINLDRNRGKGYAINRAFAETRGDFIAYQDDDDIWHKDHLERLLFPLLTIPGIDFAYSAAVDVTYDRREDGSFFETKRELIHDKQVELGDLLFQNHIQGIIVVHRRELFTKVGGMDEKLRALIDWDLWRRMAAHTYPYHVSRATADRTLRGWSETSGTGHLTSLHKTNPPAYAANRLRILRKPLALPAGSPISETLVKLRHNGAHDFLLARGEAFELQGDYRKARRAYEWAERHSPASIFAMRSLGLLAMKEQQIEEAHRMLTLVVTAKKADFKDFLYATLSCLVTDRSKEALSLITTAEQKFPREAQQNLAMLIDYRQRAERLTAG